MDEAGRLGPGSLDLPAGISSGSPHADAAVLVEAARRRKAHSAVAATLCWSR